MNTRPLKKTTKYKCMSIAVGGVGLFPYLSLQKCLKGKARIPKDDLIPKTRRGRNQHSLAFQIPSASKDVYQYSFFPQTIRDWNDLPESLISSSELPDDSVSKFTSLVRARD